MKAVTLLLFLYFSPIREVASMAEYDSASKLLTFPLHYDSQDRVYYGRIDIGKKNVQKDLKVIFDTGSSVTWVYGEHCEKCETIQPIKQLRKCEGENCQAFKDGQLESVHYGTGNVLGFRSVDYLNIQENIVSSVNKVPLSMLLLTEADNFLLKQAFEGIVGLSLNDEEKVGFINSLKKKEVIQKEEFSLYLKEDNPKIIFGGVDKSLIKSNSSIIYYPIDEQQPFWKIKIQDFSLDQAHSLLPNKTQNPSLSQYQFVNQNENGSEVSSQEIDEEEFLAHLDSGSNVLMIDLPTAELFRETMKKQFNTSCAIFKENGFNTIKCQCKHLKINDFPSLSLSFQSFKLESNEIQTEVDEEYYSIPADQYVFRDKSLPNTCLTLLYVSEDDQQKNEVLLGHPFLRNHYVHFDAFNKQIGVSLANQEKKEQQSHAWIYISGVFLIILAFYLASRQLIKQLND